MVRKRIEFFNDGNNGFVEMHGQGCLLLDTLRIQKQAIAYYEQERLLVKLKNNKPANKRRGSSKEVDMLVKLK